MARRRGWERNSARRLGACRNSRERERERERTARRQHPVTICFLLACLGLALHCLIRFTALLDTLSYEITTTVMAHADAAILPSLSSSSSLTAAAAPSSTRSDDNHRSRTTSHDSLGPLLTQQLTLEQQQQQQLQPQQQVPADHEYNDYTDDYDDIQILG